MKNKNEKYFLNDDEIIGPKALDIFKCCSPQSAITDYAILLGGYVSRVCYHINGSKNTKRTGNWWTETTRGIGQDIQKLVVDTEGELVNEYTDHTTAGVRPLVSYSSMKNIISETINSKGVKEVECGEYPQSIMDVNKDELNEILNNSQKTGKVYKFSFYNQETISCDEYIFQNKKFICVEPKDNSIGEILSNGNTIQIGDKFLVNVESIKWLVDETKDIAISKDILFSGFTYEEAQEHIKNNFIKEAFNSINIITKDNYQEKLSINNNPYGFDFSDVTQEQIIKDCIESNIPVFLHGPSSSGKSARIKQIDPNCVIIYLAASSIDSINGKSVYNNDTGVMINIKPTWLVKLEEQCEKDTKNHILFFDEVTNATPNIQGLIFNIVLDKEVNGKWKLPKNARIVCAGNELYDSMAASEVAEPLFNRCAHVYIETKLKDWLSWALENQIHPAIYSFISFAGERALRTEYTGEKPNADPRKWEAASNLLKKTNRPKDLISLIDEDLVNEFISFCRTPVITLDAILNNNYNNVDINSLNLASKYVTVMSLISVDENNVKAVREFIMKLDREFLALFDLYWTNNDKHRLEILEEINLSNKSRGGIR